MLFLFTASEFLSFKILLSDELSPLGRGSVFSLATFPLEGKNIAFSIDSRGEVTEICGNRDIVFKLILGTALVVLKTVT